MENNMKKNVCICITESLFCTAEINTTLWINCTSIKKIIMASESEMIDCQYFCWEIPVCFTIGQFVFSLLCCGSSLHGANNWVVKDKQERKTVWGPSRNWGWWALWSWWWGWWPELGLGQVTGLVCRPRSWTLFCSSERALWMGPAQVDVISRKSCEHFPEKGEAHRGPWPVQR